MEIAPTSLTTVLSLYPNIIYKWLIPAAIYCINFPVTIPDLHLILALYLVNTIYKDEAPVYNYP
jgi:hypothetical protein